MTTQIIFLLFLLLCSGFFSGMEIALFSLGIETLHAELAKPGLSVGRRARLTRLQSLLADPHRTLVTILLCNNVVNILASSVATVTALSVAGSFDVPVSQSTILAIVTGVMTFLILLFGEITPKALAHQHALKFSERMAGFLWGLRWLATPIAVPLSKLTEKFVGEHEAKGLTEDEIKAAISLSESSGTIDEAERALVEKVLEFDEVRAEAIMTPRSKIFALKGEDTVGDVLPQVIAEQYSRIPIMGESLDDIWGILTVHNLLKHWHEKKGAATLKTASLTKPIKVPPSMRIPELLRLFQAEHTSHLALVVNQHNETTGVITMEDVLEEIFGEIHDETDKESVYIKRIGDATWRIDAEVELERLETVLRDTLEIGDMTLHMPWPREMENESLRYFLIEKLEHFPEVGEALEVSSGSHVFQLTVKSKTDDTQAKMVELQLTEQAEGQDE